MSTKEIRPAVNGADQVSKGRSLESDSTAQPVALTALDRHAAFLAGYDLGWAHGRNAGQLDEDRAALHAPAAAVVLALAGHPEIDPERTRARRGRWDAAWDARSGGAA